MKNKHIYYLLLPLVVVFNLVITGCESTEESGNAGSGGNCSFQFCLKLPEAISVETKATTPTIGDKNEATSVKNVWILQYDASGNFIKSFIKSTIQAMIKILSRKTTIWSGLILMLHQKPKSFLIL